MDSFSIHIGVEMINEEYGNISVEPSRQMETDEIIMYLEWVLDVLDDPPPHLKVMK